MTRYAFLLFVVTASPAIAQTSTQTVATADMTYRQRIEQMQAQQLAAQTAALAAACQAAKSSGNGLPLGCK
jgi:hypothetical protein